MAFVAAGWAHNMQKLWSVSHDHDIDHLPRSFSALMNIKLDQFDFQSLGID